ncbi:hypothetical protein [Enterococcus malodoratus]|uniref:hypothetical protein n=1 Tax=Enterococcus malodoratus TaxID=71451 RepID=UPI000B88C12E|nr:hypothetical protein [Enterococcus malodoratus]
MVYRPRYLDEKRRNCAKILINTQLKDRKIVMNYSDSSKVIATKEKIEFFDSNGDLKCRLNEKGEGEIYERF